MGIAKKHLSEIERKDIAKDLFTVTSTEERKGELHGLCPIHQESNPSFSYNFQKDQYNCFSCGAGGDIIKLWIEVNGLSQTEGFKAFCEKFGLPLMGRERKGAPAREGEGGSGPEPEIDPQLVMEQMRRAWENFSALPDAWIERLQRTRGWSRKCIEILDLRLETYRMKKTGDLVKLKRVEKVAIPVRDSQGNLVNIRLYHQGAKQYKMISFARSTGSSRLVPAKPLILEEAEKERPPRMPQDETSSFAASKGSSPSFVVLSEGETDLACALSMGLSAITQTSKLKNWPTDHIAVFKGEDVVIAYDADRPGQKYAIWAARALLGTAKRIRMIQWPLFMGVEKSGDVPKSHGQDLTDFFVSHKRSLEDFYDLVEAATKISSMADLVEFAKKYLSKTELAELNRPKENGPPPAPTDPDPSHDVKQFCSYGINNRFSFRPRLLAEKIMSETPLLRDDGSGFMYRWNGKYWELYSEDHLRTRAIKYLGNESQSDRVQDTVFQIKMLSLLPHNRKVNDQVDWLNLQNGMLNIYADEMRPHDRSFYFTHVLPVEFNPESQKRCDVFEGFLRTNIKTPEVIQQLQEFTGYCFLRNADYEKCLFMIGPGADGKSRYMMMLNELIGPENCSAVSLEGLDDHFQRSHIHNKMVNISGESRGNYIETEYFKKIASGDKINASFKGKDFFDFIPYCKQVFAGNTFPRVKDNSDGYFRKILPIEFKRQFLESDPDRDPHIVKKFKAELSEIFYWAYCGLKRLLKNGYFTESDETRELLLGYRRSNNPLMCFLEDECIEGEGKDFEVSKEALFDSYSKYCSKNGYSRLGLENFWRDVMSAKKALRIYRPSKNNPKRQRFVENIRLKTEIEKKKENDPNLGIEGVS